MNLTSFTFTSQNKTINRSNLCQINQDAKNIILGSQINFKKSSFQLSYEYEIFLFLLFFFKEEEPTCMVELSIWGY